LTSVNIDRAHRPSTAVVGVAVCACRDWSLSMWRRHPDRRISDHLAYTETKENRYEGPDIEGTVSLVTYKQRPDLVWSKNSDLMLADAAVSHMG